jgi:hypothetical protein
MAGRGRGEAIRQRQGGPLREVNSPNGGVRRYFWVEYLIFLDEITCFIIKSPPQSSSLLSIPISIPT